MSWRNPDAIDGTGLASLLQEITAKWSAIDHEGRWAWRPLANEGKKSLRAQLTGPAELVSQVLIELSLEEVISNDNDKIAPRRVHPGRLTCVCDSHHDFNTRSDQSMMPIEFEMNPVLTVFIIIYLLGLYLRDNQNGTVAPQKSPRDLQGLPQNAKFCLVHTCLKIDKWAKAPALERLAP